MNPQTAVPTVTDVTQLSSSLADHMDSAIGEATSVMGALVTELIRRSLRGGVLQIGQGLSDYVGERVDATIVEKTPVLEQIANDVADRTARSAATEVAKEETGELARTTRESDQQLATRIEQTAASAQQATSEAARDLATRIDEAEKRACETARGEMAEQIGELRQKSRETVAALKDRLKLLKETAVELGKRLAEEQQERRAAEAALKEDAQQTIAKLRQELEERSLDLLRKLHEEVDGLRNANASLVARVAELEKPRGLRALFRRLMFWRKR